MELITITLCTFFASLLTLYSGFGLGTLLMPVAAIFLPVPLAVALTAFVHLANNLCKLALTHRHVHWAITLRFGVPALLASLPGAWLLAMLGEHDRLLSYPIAHIQAEVTPVKLVAGSLLLLFATMELFPVLQRLGINHKALPIGGVLSGFFGGLSGHQGAFRSAFLIQAGLDKHQFVATNAAIASLVDIARLLVYAASFSTLTQQVNPTLLASASIAAFIGVFLGVVWLKKITFSSIQRIVAGMLYMLGTLLILGII